MNSLRVLNKYHNHFLSAYGLDEEIGDFIKKQIENLRSNLIKNGLLFSQELFSVQKANPQIVPFACHILPAILIKTVYEKNFVVVEAKKSMEQAAANCAFPEMIQILSEGSESKS